MGDVDKVLGTFTGEKINKIRWKPEDLIESNYYVYGSRDNDIDHLTVWSYTEHSPDGRPIKVASCVHDGDVTELKFITSNTFVASSSSGSVNLFRLDTKDVNSTKLSVIHSYEKLHFFRTGEHSPITALACFEEDFVTVGEDGRIVLLTAKRITPSRVIDEADSCSLRCVCFLRHNSIITGNLRGQMKIWDLNSPNKKATSDFSISGDNIGAASCISQHPSQQHMVLAGGEDGSLTVWDLRKNNIPVTLLSAHSGTVSEVMFHPDRPDHMFTCSQSGEIWHWNSSSMARGSILSSVSDGPTNENPWLSSDAAKHRLEVYSLMTQLHMPINSLDVNKNHVICGCDNEATYLIKNIDNM